MYMTLLYGHTDTPDAILLRTQVGGHLYTFPDETIRPMPQDHHVAVRRCHLWSVGFKGVDASSSVERGDGLLVIEAAVCVGDAGRTVVSVTQHTVAAVVRPMVGHGIVIAGVEGHLRPHDTSGASADPLGVIIAQPDARYMHQVGTPLDASLFHASRKRFPSAEIARLVAAFEADALAMTVDSAP